MLFFCRNRLKTIITAVLLSLSTQASYGDVGNHFRSKLSTGVRFLTNVAAVSGFFALGASYLWSQPKETAIDENKKSASFHPTPQALINSAKNNTLNTHYQYLPILMSLAGTIIFPKIGRMNRWEGALLGDVIGLSDFLLMSLGLSSNPHLSAAIVGAGMTSPIEQQSKKGVVVGLLAGLSVSLGWTSQLPAYIVDTPFSVADKLKSDLSRMQIEQSDLGYLWNLQSFVMIPLYILQTVIEAKLFTKYGDIRSLLRDLIPENSARLRQSLSLYAYLLLPSLIVGVIDRYCTHHVNFILKRRLRDSLYMWEQEKYLNLRGKRGAEANLAKLDKQLKQLPSIGAPLVSGGFKTYIKGMQSIAYLGQFPAIKYLAPAFVAYHLLIRFVTHFPTQKIDDLYEEMKSPKAKVQRIENHIKEHPIEQAQSGYLKKLQDHRTRIIQTEVSPREDSAASYMAIQEALNHHIPYVKYGIKFALIGWTSLAGLMPVSAFYQTDIAIDNSLGVFNWASANSDKLAQFARAHQRLNSVLDEIEASSHGKSNISYLGSAQEPQLVLRGLSFGFGEKKLLEPAILTLSKGTYALTGRKGVGKTSFLSIIMGVLANKLSVQGELQVIMGLQKTKHRIWMIGQKNYLPPYASLESLMHVDSDNKEEDLATTTKAKELLTTLDLLPKDLILLDSWNEEFDTSFLSGGQKAGIEIVRAILHKPQILLVDETFANLDNKSTRLVQEMLQTELKDSLIIATDHNHASLGQDFYTHRLHFSENRTLNLTPY